MPAARTECSTAASQRGRVCSDPTTSACGLLHNGARVASMRFHAPTVRAQIRAGENVILRNLDDSRLFGACRAHRRPARALRTRLSKWPAFGARSKAPCSAVAE